MRSWTFFVALALAGRLAWAEALHGMSDFFAAPGVAVAWAVERGPDEPRTFVVINVAIDRSRFESVSVTGRDPFTKQEKVWVAREPAGDRLEVRLPRSGFADFPRTELRFFDSAGATPKVEVYYLGVPDTTPEFADRAKLQAYLASRLARLDPGPSSR